MLEVLRPYVPVCVFFSKGFISPKCRNASAIKNRKIVLKSKVPSYEMFLLPSETKSGGNMNKTDVSMKKNVFFVLSVIVLKKCYISTIVPY